LHSSIFNWSGFMHLRLWCTSRKNVFLKNSTDLYISKALLCSRSYSPVSRNSKKCRIYVVNRMHFMSANGIYDLFRKIWTITWGCVLIFIINLLSIESICFLNKNNWLHKRFNFAVLYVQFFICTFIVCFVASASISANLYFFVRI